jgi:adenylosuccinate lyase
MNRTISPLDSRYKNITCPAGEYFSEFALMRERCRIESIYFEALCNTKLFGDIDPKEIKKVGKISDEFSDEDMASIKKIESLIKHDMKACVNFIRERSGIKNKNMIHFGLTSEDINNLAYSSLISRYIKEVQLPGLRLLIKKLCAMAKKYRKMPFPANTHGRPASPSTVGKELAVFIERLSVSYKKIENMKFKGKLNGATGNYSAMHSAFPEFDWIAFTDDIIKSLGFKSAMATVQTESHDSWAEYFDAVRSVNSALLKLAQDIWHYISFGYFRLAHYPEETGSSAMPHKVNPTDFETGEGMLKISNALLVVLSGELCVTRMQRDLSDSVMERYIGEALANSQAAVSKIDGGLSKVEPDGGKCISTIEEHPELLAEMMCAVLNSVTPPQDAYEELKEICRGKNPDIETMKKFVESKKIPGHIKKRILGVRASEYIGMAERICIETVKKNEKELNL